MRVFVAGASGAIGTRLVPQLINQGHGVIGTATSAERAKHVRTLGAEAIVLDLLDPRAVRDAVLSAEPEAIVHEATALANLSDFKHFDRSFAQTNRLRTEGTDALLATASEVGVRRFVAQSYATARYARDGGIAKSEDDPLDSNVPEAARQSWDAMAYLDRVVSEAGGIVLRYGVFYGEPDDVLVQTLRKRMWPIVGQGGGVTSFIHLDDAAAATVLALEHDGPAVYNIVDDEPAPARVWLPEVARIVGAKPPRRFPTWLARLFAGETVVLMGTESRGASNAKAKRELGWTLRYPSWRQGFAELYAGTSPDAPAARPRRDTALRARPR
jgi:nucleoside-diphosphate-sugar epimerase